MNESRFQDTSRAAGSKDPAHAEHPHAASIREELHRILESHSFKSSRRSQHFLQYVVENALAGRTGELKERIIGVAVFGRAPAYDTGEDATVRVAANEVRKRLAQYQQEAPARDVRIELPPGSYSPEFRLPAAPPQAEPLPPQTSTPAWWRSRVFQTAAALIILLSIAFILFKKPPTTAFQEFWRPVTDSSRPVLVCMAHPVMFQVNRRLQDGYRAKGYTDTPATANEGKTVAIELQPGDIVQTDQYVGSGDAHATGLFSALLARLEKPAQLRIGNDVSFSDLRSSPSILIGAYSNQWTMQSNAEYRFGFGRHSVVDHGPSAKEWKLVSVTPDYRSPEDYAIISRVLHSYSGEPVITAAGTTNVGTRAAAEFLTNPAYLNEALAKAPPGWQKKNLQMVLYCKVIGSTPGPPKVVAAHFW